MNPKKKKLSDSDLLKEEVHPNEVHDNRNALKSVINGKRDVGFIELTTDFEKQIVKHGIGVIPTRMTAQNKMMAIIYRDIVKGHKLYEFAKRNNGYLTDHTASEAREIGRLLGYSEDSIEEYVNKKYGRTVPLRTDGPDDYNDLQEQNFPEFEKQIKKDESGYGLDKKFIIKLGDAKIYAVNADFVRDKDPGLGFNGFTDGGSHYVTSLPGYKKIPEDEIWIDDVFLSKPNDLGAFILHELLERHLMKYYGVPYDTAHADYAEKAEPLFRKKVKNGLGLDMIETIYNDFVHKYAEHHRTKKLHESFQFNETIDLMKKVI